MDGTRTDRKSRAREIALCALFAALIGAGAWIRIPVPVTPFTLQFLFTNLAGLLLGRRLGALAVLAYLAVGLAGLPVFAGGGGPMYLFQPTFGYLIGFLFGTWVAGAVVQRAEKKTFFTYLGAGLLNLGVVYLLGILYYYVIATLYLGTSLGFWTLFFYCFVLAVPGDLLLCIVSATVAGRMGRALRKGGILIDGTEGTGTSKTAGPGGI